MKFIIFLLVSFLLSPAHAQNAAWNEMYDESGQMRPAYVEFYQNHPEIKIAPNDKRIDHLTNLPLDDNIKIHPIPLVLTPQEIKLIRAGSLQRLRAIMMFFSDLIVGNEKIMANDPNKLWLGIVNQIFVSESHLNINWIQLMTDTWISRGVGALRALYGPDIVRAPDGKFTVLEDNFGNLGGIADVDWIHQRYFDANSDKNIIPDDMALEKIILQFLKETGSVTDLKDVIALVHMDDPYARKVRPTDQEWFREKFILERLGIRVIDPQNEGCKHIMHLIANATGYRRIINFADPSALFEGADFTKALSNFSRNKLNFFIPPGISFFGNKAFLPFVPLLIKFYLNEEPILETAETSWSTIDTIGEDVEELRDQVIKESSSSQGRGVYIGKNLNHKAFVRLQNKMGRDRSIAPPVFSGSESAKEIYENPISAIDYPNFVTQKFIDTSYLPVEQSWIGFNVDMRPMTYLSMAAAYVHPKIWGRASLKLPGVLNNVSQGAFELVVTDSKPKVTNSSCEFIFKIKTPHRDQKPTNSTSLNRASFFQRVWGSYLSQITNFLNP